MDVKSLTLEGLQYFKTKQDAFNDGKFATKASVPTKVSQLTNDSEFQTKTQLDTAINQAIAAVMTYKGVKATVGELPEDDNKLGDVWHVTADSAEYAWDGTKWEALGGLLQASVDWDDITGKPSEFTPAEHSHDDATTGASGFMSAADKTKLDGIDSGANNYVHPTSPAGAKPEGLYKVTTDATGHVTAATAVTKADITGLGVNALPEGGTEGQFVQNKSGVATWADGLYLADGVVRNGNADVAEISLKSAAGAGGKSGVVEISAGDDTLALQMTDVNDKVLPIGIVEGKSSVGLGQSPIDYIYAADVADVATADKLVPNSASVKKYVESKIVVDGSLSDASTNPVQNKVVKAALDGKAATGHTHTIANVTGLQGALDAKADGTHTHADATTSVSGFMSAADKTKLDGLNNPVAITNGEIDGLFSV